MPYPVVFVNIGHLRNVCPEPDNASASEEMGGQRTCQDDDKREVQQHHSNPLVEPLLHDIGKGCHREHRPQGREPPGTINLLTDE